ncbi:hypothetical protein BDV18DRAFT_27492 [Aspergillus unguis]
MDSWRLLLDKLCPHRIRGLCKIAVLSVLSVLSPFSDLPLSAAQGRFLPSPLAQFPRRLSALCLGTRSVHGSMPLPHSSQATYSVLLPCILPSGQRHRDACLCHSLDSTIKLPLAASPAAKRRPQATPVLHSTLIPFVGSNTPIARTSILKPDVRLHFQQPLGKVNFFPSGKFKSKQSGKQAC